MEILAWIILAAFYFLIFPAVFVSENAKYKHVILGFALLNGLAMIIGAVFMAVMWAVIVVIL